MADVRVWMPMYWGDYLKDTTHLSASEHGAYLLLIARYWTSGKPLPNENEKLRQISRMTTKEWNRSRATILEFFVVDGDFLRHERVESEIVRATNKSEKAAKSASHRHGKSEQNQQSDPCERNADAMRTQSERSAFAMLEGCSSQSHSQSPSQSEEKINKYAFNGRVIKLKQSDFDAWKSAYHSIDLRAALMKVDAWLDANGGDNWFFRASKWLENDHQKALQANKQPEPSHPTVEALTAVLGALNRQMAIDLINAAKSEEKALAVIEDARQDENPVEFVRRWIRKQATRKPELFAHLDPRDRPYVPAMGG